MKLTEHFTLEELTHSPTAVRLGFDNSPPDEAVGNLRLLAEGLEQIRRVTGQALRIDSGYRCEALERVLCAKDFAAWCDRHGRADLDAAWPDYFAGKAHPKGFAADFTCAAFGSPLEIVRVIKASGIKFDKAICEGGWVHVSFAPELRGSVMTASFDATGTPHYAELAS